MVEVEGNRDFIPMEIPPLPEIPVFPTEKIARWGETTMGYAGFGHPISIEEIKYHFEKQGLLTGKEARTLENLGVDGGYYLPWEFNPSKPEYQRMQAPYVAEFCLHLLEQHGWTDYIDILVFASASASPLTAQQTAETLENKGIRIKEFRFAGEACNGAMGSIMNLNHQEEARGVRALVLGAEWLSGGLINPKDKQVIGTFGAGIGGALFRPQVDMKYIMGTKVVKKDTGGITIPLPYDLPPSDQWAIVEDVYPNYTFADEESRHILVVDLKGNTYLQIAASEDEYAQMNGFPVVKYFVPLTSDLIVDTLADYHMNYEQTYGPIENPAICHQPSKPVLDGVCKAVNKKIEGRANKGISVPSVEMPWLMEGTGMNNVSSATFFVPWTKLVDEGRLELDKPTLWVGMAVGGEVEVSVAENY